MIRRPWFEATPALSAHGLHATHALTADHVIGHHIRPNPGKRPMVPTDARFVLLPRLDAVTKPKQFSGPRPLAMHIESLRTEGGGDPALQLEEVDDLRFADWPGLYDGVQIWVLDASNDRDRSLGYAYLDGRGRDVLEPALRAVRKDAQRSLAA